MNIDWKTGTPEHNGYYLTWTHGDVIPKVRMWSCGALWHANAAPTEWFGPIEPPAPVPQACPFCGEPAEFGGACYVSCSSGGCGLEGPVRDTTAEAVHAWNRLRVNQE